MRLLPSLALVLVGLLASCSVIDRSAPRPHPAVFEEWDALVRMRPPVRIIPGRMAVAHSATLCLNVECDEDTLLLWLVNGTDKIACFGANCGRLMMVREAMDDEGQWRPIEDPPRAT